MNTRSFLHKLFYSLLAAVWIASTMFIPAEGFQPSAFILHPSSVNLHPSAVPDDAWWQPDYTSNGPNSDVRALAVDDQGRVYSGGWFTAVGDQSIWGVARWTPGPGGYGTWSALGSGINGFVNALLWADGHLYVGGRIMSVGGVNYGNLVRWTPDASGPSGTWESVGGIVNAEVSALAYDPVTQTLYAGGVFLQAGSVFPNRVAAYQEGSGWNVLPCPALGNGIDMGVVNALVWTPEGLYAGGSFDHACSGLVTAHNIARWTQAGGWQSLASGGVEGTDGTVRALTYDPAQHDLYVGGYFSHAAGSAITSLARWNLGASAWTEVRAAFDAAVYALLWDDTGKLVIGGTKISEVDSILAVFDPAANRLFAAGALGPRQFELVSALAGRNDDLFVGGTFEGAGGEPALRIAHIFKYASTPMVVQPNRGISGKVNAMVSDGKGGLYVGGDFLFAGERLVNNIAHWIPGENGGSWVPLGSGLDGEVTSLAYNAAADVLYVGGAFDNAYYAIAAAGFACWHPYQQIEGGSWAACGYGRVNGRVNALAVDQDGHVYVGGSFTEVGGVAYANLVRYNPATDNWSGVGDITGSPATVYALHALGNTIYIGGRFDHANGIPANNVASWDPFNGWSVLAQKGGTGVNGTVYAFASLPGTVEVYVGGRFSSAGMLAQVDNIAKWNPSDSVWLPLAGTLDQNPQYSTVYTLAFDSQDQLYAGGTIFRYDANIRALARYTGADWTGVGSGVDHNVYSLVTTTPRSIFVGGDFSRAGDTASASFARYLHPIYVEADAAGANSGNSWQDAFTDLHAGLAAAGPGDEVWVAQGTYKTGTTSERNLTFMIPNLVRAYGGFAGTESRLAERDWGRHPVVLSADIGAAGVSTDNSYHVVDASYVHAGTVLDGFTLRGGYADGDGSGAAVGGGILSLYGSPTLSHLTITENYARSAGGGLFNYNGTPFLLDTLFYANQALEKGGAIGVEASSIVAANVTLSGNSSALGGAVSASGERQTLVNFIIWNNPTTTGGEIQSEVPSSLWLSFGILKGGCLAGAGFCDQVTDADPLFANPAQGIFRLAPVSPAIDRGNPEETLESNTRDLAARPRRINFKGYDVHIDLGAFEAQTRAMMPIIVK